MGAARLPWPSGLIICVHTGSPLHVHAQLRRYAQSSTQCMHAESIGVSGLSQLPAALERLPPVPAGAPGQRRKGQPEVQTAHDTPGHQPWGGTQ